MRVRSSIGVCSESVHYVFKSTKGAMGNRNRTNTSGDREVDIATDTNDKQ